MSIFVSLFPLVLKMSKQIPLIKIVCIGDASSQKSSLIHAFTNKGSHASEPPNTVETTDILVSYKGKRYQLSIWNTPCKKFWWIIDSLFQVVIMS